MKPFAAALALAAILGAAAGAADARDGVRPGPGWAPTQAHGAAWPPRRPLGGGESLR